jgi:hypothetical protein
LEKNFQKILYLEWEGNPLVKEEFPSKVWIIPYFLLEWIKAKIDKIAKEPKESKENKVKANLEEKK